MCTAGTLLSLRQLHAGFCCYRHCGVLVHCMVTSWHDMPPFRFKGSKDVTHQGLVCILPCTIHTLKDQTGKNPPLPLKVAQKPSWPGPSHFWDFAITIRHTILGRTPLRLVISPTQRPLQHTTLDRHTNIHVSGRWKPTDPHLRPCGHWDQHRNL